MPRTKKETPLQDESKLHCKTLMRDGDWLVPEEERPDIAPPPRELSKSEQRVESMFSVKGGLPAYEDPEKIIDRIARERPDGRCTPAGSPGRSGRLLPSR